MNLHFLNEITYLLARIDQQTEILRSSSSKHDGTKKTKQKKKSQNKRNKTKQNKQNKRNKTKDLIQILTKFRITKKYKNDQKTRSIG